MKLRDIGSNLFQSPHDETLDRAIGAMHEEACDPAVERAAAARVWERLQREAGKLAEGGADREGEAAEGAHQPITSCTDYQGLIPAYLAGRLPAAKALLLEDHSRECVPCRKALKAARQGAASTASAPRRAATRPGASRPAWGGRVWGSLAAGLLLVAGATGLLTWTDLFGGGDVIAQVRSVDGQLFRLEGDAAVALAPGERIREHREMRTGRDSGAIVRLDDGSLIELRERSAISLARSRGETTIRVNRGSIIVEAAKQHGHLYVATDDCLVSVTGTIFAVDHGTKGSRVAVVEGEVHVEEGRSEHVLRPGDRVATGTKVAAGTVEQDIAWSRDRERYVALLHELETLNQEMNRALSSSELRYQSRLVDLVPAATAVYVAMPNVTTDLADFQRFLADRLAQNETLATWWHQHLGDDFDQHLGEIVQRVAGLGQHLGEEIVVAVPIDTTHDSSAQPHTPVLLAEVANPSAFAAVLAEEVARLNAGPDGPHLRIVSDPATAAPGNGNELLLWPAGDVFAASPDLAALATLAATLPSPSGNPFVATTFHGRLVEAYSQGAQWLVGVDLEHLVSASMRDERGLAFSGLATAKDLVLERKTANGTTHTGAVLSFAGERSGALGWLAAPAPMGSLDFISADANLAAAFVVEQPAQILEQTFRFIETMDPDFRDQLARFEAEHGVRVVDDLAAPLGGEMAFAIDGPALPKPAWKVIAEVYDQARFEQSVEWAITEANRAAQTAGKPTLDHSQETVGGRVYYRVALSNGLFEMYYTFDGGYFLAAPSRTLLDRAMQVRDSGLGIKTAAVFRDLLPQDAYLDFSGLVFTHLGALGQTLVSTIAPNLPEEQRLALTELNLDAPSLTCVYGEHDRIRLVTSGQGGILGSRLAGFLGLSALSGRGL